MRTKEVLAVVGTCTALGGAVGLAAESHGRAKADNNVVVGEACRDTYDNARSHIGSQVLECMREGWVPHAGRADDGDGAEMEADYPDGLLEGYIKGQQARAERVELFKIAWWAIGGALVGLWSSRGVRSGGGGRGGGGREEIPKSDKAGGEVVAFPESESPAASRSVG